MNTIITTEHDQMNGSVDNNALHGNTDGTVDNRTHSVSPHAGS